MVYGNKTLGSKDGLLFNRKSGGAFLYLMKDKVSGYCKIGMQESLVYGNKILQYGKPNTILLGYKKYEDREEAGFKEGLLQILFAEFEIENGWFLLSDKQIGYILNIMN